MSAQVVVQALQQSVSPDAAARKAAEEQLAGMESQPGFALALLQVLESEGNKHTQQLTAVYFKNLVRKHWGEDGKENSGSQTVLSPKDRAQIKEHLLTLMCKVDPAVRPIMSEAVRLIGVTDFPDNWQNLLPDLTAKLAATHDFTVIIGLLETANALFKMFRDVPDNDEIRLKLKTCLTHFQTPLRVLYEKCVEMVNKAAAAPQRSEQDIEQLRQVLASLRLLTRIFYSLSWIDIPEDFQDHAGKWAELFLATLQWPTELTPLRPSDDDEKPGPVEEVQTAVIVNLQKLSSVHEEDFGTFAKNFTEATWALLIRTPTLVRFDLLVVAGTNYLAELISIIRLTDLFRPVLGDIITKIVVPNIMLRDHDRELFEDNPMEFIRRDIEGSDSHTRRKVACNLVSKMCKHFERETTELCQNAENGVLPKMIAASEQGDWRSLDGAITLMLALAVKGYTFSTGVSEVNPNVNVEAFFERFVMPGLMEENVNSEPVVKADVIKFFSTFRNQMPRAVVVERVMPALVRLLSASSFVVHTYAASALERLFMIRDPVPNTEPLQLTYRYGAAELTPILGPSLLGLFNILEQHENGTDNEYVAKAVMRLLVKATNEQAASAAPDVLGKLKAVLGRVCEKPQNPSFNHFLFESLAVLIRSSCRHQPALAEQYEQSLMQPFQHVLHQEVAELTPYVFEVLALMLELRPGGASESYLALFPPLLRPVVWENRGNIPALVRLVEAYINKAPKETVLADPSRLEGLLGVWQRLLSINSHAELSMHLLSGMVAQLPPESFSKYLGSIMQLLTQRLQSMRRKTFAQASIEFLSVLVGKIGAVPVRDAMGPAIFIQITSLWVDVNKMISKPIKRKASAIALTRVLAEMPELAVAPNELAGANIFLGIMHLFESRDHQTATKTEEETLADLESAGYSASYSKLVYAQLELRDPFKEVEDARATFCKTLGAAMQERPALKNVVQHALGDKPGLSASFSSYCQRYGVSL